MGSVSSPGIGRHTWLPPNNSSKTPRWIARGAKNLLSAAGIAFNPDRMPSLSSFPGRAEIGWSDRGPFAEVAGCRIRQSGPESASVGQGADQWSWPFPGTTAIPSGAFRMRIYRGFRSNPRPKRPEPLDSPGVGRTEAWHVAHLKAWARQMTAVADP